MVDNREFFIPDAYLFCFEYLEAIKLGSQTNASMTKLHATRPAARRPAAHPVFPFGVDRERFRIDCAVARDTQRVARAINYT